MNGCILTLSEFFSAKITHCARYVCIYYNYKNGYHEESKCEPYWICLKFSLLEAFSMHSISVLTFSVSLIAWSLFNLSSGCGILLSALKYLFGLCKLQSIEDIN